MKDIKKGISKLVRDNIPKIMKDHGETPKVTLASQKILKQVLRQKLAEEAQEVIAAFTKKRLREELADMIEVVESIAELEDISLESIQDKKQKKALRRGRFKKAIY